MSTRLLRHIGAAISVVVVVIGFGPPAHAQPDEEPVPAGEVTLSLAEAGSATMVSFYGDTSVTSLSFPVPPGLRPNTLNATLDLPFAMRSAVLSVTQDDRLISKVDLPLTDFAPVVIPLDSVEVTDDSVNLTVKLNALAGDGFCLDQANPVGLVNGSITYTGAMTTPATIADFLPPILRTLTIGVPESPSQAESDAAVQLAAALQARYRSQAPQVVLVPIAADATSLDGPAQPMERRIVIKEGPDEGLSLRGGADPQLLITGPADKLTNQARLLTDGSLDLAVSTEVVAGALHSNTFQPGDSTTLAQLGQPALSNAGVAPQVRIALDQTRFGHPTQGFRVHVMGSHTPAPADFGAQMTASVNDEIIDSWPAAGDGMIDHWVEIPDRLVQRFTELVVAVDTSGVTGRCGEFRPVTLAISGSTVVESTPSQPPIPSGFVSLPQALMPGIQIGMTPGSFVDTQRAVQIAVGLQRLSVVPLLTEVASLQQAIDSEESAVLISADGWTDPSVTLPVSSQDQRLSLVGFGAGDQETTLTLDPGIRFGSIQSVFDGQRSLLVATSNGAPAQLDELLRWLGRDPQGWAKLRGSAVVSIEGREPQLVPGRTPLSVYGPSTSTQTQAQGDGGGAPAGWIAAGVVTALAVGIGAYWLGSRRRPEQPSASLGADEKET